MIQQTDKICKIAVQENANALQYVENQTREICILALNSAMNMWMNPKFIFAHIKDDNLRKEIYQTNINVISYYHNHIIKI